MSPTQKKRFTIVAVILGGAAITTFFALQAVQKNIEYFLTPSQINDGKFKIDQRYKVAGLVKKNSLITASDGITRDFTITDCANDVQVQYTGILPDLFREGQAIVAVGKLNTNKKMLAAQVLAKHDENYVPNEAAETMMMAQANKCDGAEGAVKF